jgi:hypothetical protein
MKAKLKDIDLSRAVAFKDFSPENARNFCVWATAHIGIEGEKGAHLFQIQICTPEYLSRQISSSGPMWGRHMLIVQNYNAAEIRLMLERYLETCVGADWNEIGPKVARIGHWEFEDYKP